MTQSLATLTEGGVLPAGFSTVIRDEVAEVDDQAVLAEYRDRLAALEGYLARKSEDCAEVRKAQRYVEQRIGELLGAAQHGGDRTKEQVGPDQLARSIPKHERSEFRAMAAHPEVVAEAIDDGETTRKGIVARIRKHRRQQARDERQEAHDEWADTEAADLTVVPTEFSAIVIDPPWQYDNKATRGAAEDHYRTMSIDQLAKLELPAADKCHLYLWVTNGFLREGFDLIDAWGFTYKTTLTWCKPQIGLGNWFRNSTEHVLFAVKGSLPTQRNDVPTWFVADRTRHSAKPESFYDLVEACSPGPWMEMFARRRRFNWHTWGNEA